MSNLDPTQIQLLCDLVEAERSIPRDERQHFLVLRTLGGPGVEIVHPGLGRDHPRVFEGDIETLASNGLLRTSYGGSGTTTLYVTNEGFTAYESIKAELGEPEKVIEEEVSRYLDSSAFRIRYPAAHAKWNRAAAGLWGAEADKQHSTIGHLLREAVQEFAYALANRYTDKTEAKANTIANVRDVLTEAASKLGTTERPFLDALLAYWGTLIDLIQRQEHEAERESEELNWEDSRRVVFQTAILMYEIDRAVKRAFGS